MIRQALRPLLAALTLTAAVGTMPTALAFEPQVEPPPPKVLRYAFEIAETGFDPAQISDTYSRTITPHIFEALFTYDYLARPATIRPLTAAAMPEVSDHYRRFIIKVQPGIYFADDPAFKGKPRELVAQDYVYSLKRMADPALKSQTWATLEEQGVLGLAELRKRALGKDGRFDIDTPVEGIKALDRYTLQFLLKEPRPRFLEFLTQSDVAGAVAREVVEAYGSEIMAHPVGTGPFVLKQWRRNSLIVLEKNPAYRERYYDARPNADDAEGQAWLARFKGRRLPMIDRVEVSIIEESQPRWLSFLNGEHDLIYKMPLEFINVALPGGKLAPNLQKRGMKLVRTLASDTAFTFFNMEHPVLGGYTPDKVALRRALSLAFDIQREIHTVRRGQAIPAQSLILPHTSGYDPAYRSELSEYNPAKAKALLDLYGYVDKDGDGWRDLPDGSPLVIEVATQPDSLSRSFDELTQRNLSAVGIRTRFSAGKWPEQLKQARAGKLMLWMLGSTASAPDGQGALQRMYGPQAGEQNLARFKNAEFDALYDRMKTLPDGPEREALFLQAKRIQAAYMPVKNHVHRIANDIHYDWVTGYRRPVFGYEFFHLIDIDPKPRPATQPKP